MMHFLRKTQSLFRLQQNLFRFSTQAASATSNPTPLTQPIEDPLKLFQQKYTPKLLQHQSVLFAISPENRLKLELDQVKNDKIFLAFFRKFSGVDVFQHAKKCDDPSQLTNTPRNCWYQIKVPFSDQIELRTRFQKHYSDCLRVSKLLEVLDHIASKVAYDFCYDSLDVTISTLYVDHMNFYKQMDSVKDLYISGYPTYQKGNQIEVQVDLMQPNENGELVLSSCASFLLAAKEKATGLPYANTPKLVFDGEESQQKCENRYNIGKENNFKRQYSNNRINLVSAPEKSEIDEIHQIFLENDLSNDSNNPNKIRMEQTLEQKVLLMQSQERNLDGQIYGGHLMKESIDLAWISAYNLVNTPQKHHVFPEICHLDDFQFVLPVEVSNIINFECKVVYVYGQYVMVQAQCLKVESSTKKRLSTQSYMIFRIENYSNETPLKNVYPLTYKESLIYLEAKRRFHEIIHSE